MALIYKLKRTFEIFLEICTQVPDKKFQKRASIEAVLNRVKEANDRESRRWGLAEGDYRELLTIERKWTKEKQKSDRAKEMDRMVKHLFMCVELNIVSETSNRSSGMGGGQTTFDFFGLHPLSPQPPLSLKKDLFGNITFLKQLVGSIPGNNAFSPLSFSEPKRRYDGQ